MKGVIVNCLEELVSTRLGKKFWQNALEEAGLKPMMIFCNYSVCRQSSPII
ncbi:hypothetical protein U14_05215 [Candidatus Moduliflexus flocculans]|uniref:Uncharacterized protein n=1 Tax=Candidatus Moduliflexus flocculans TaxID=1499966 RepID=A0A081BRA7_9BACT|nr:hypothetical protein U14_05215 [Candidatus Moduliflexus flocculans]